MEPRINLITLGVADVAVATAFYERLGFRRSKGASQPSITFCQAGPLVLALFGRAALAEDAGLSDPGRRGFGGITLAHNVASPEAVTEVYEAALAAGATSLKPPEKAFWGGFTCYFADPDGHPWEVAHNPFIEVDDQGMMRLPA